MSSPATAIRDNRRSVSLNVLLAGLAWLVLVTIALFEFGVQPRTIIGWGVVIAVGPIAWLGLQVAGEFVFWIIGSLPWVRRSREWVERRTAGQRVSFLRIGYVLVGGVLLLAVAIVLIVYKDSLPSLPAAVQDFVTRHFR